VEETSLAELLAAEESDIFGENAYRPKRLSHISLKYRENRYRACTRKSEEG